MKKFFIMDGNAYVHRAYHALPPFFTSYGQQTNAVYGFVNLLLKIKNDFIFDYIVVCFDYPSKNFRYEIFKYYKANRGLVDKSIVNQMQIAKKATEILSIAKLEVDGYEADDLIATVVENNKKNDVQIIIITPDKDMFQLIEKQNVLVWNYSKNIMYDEKKIESIYDVKPRQLVDVFALTGDVTDNVPGVNGIGKKTAIKLIKKFETVENILENLDFINDRTGKLIKNNINNLLMSKKLIALNKCVPLSFELKNFKSVDLNLNKIVNFFKKYEFKSLFNKLQQTKKND